MLECIKIGYLNAAGIRNKEHLINQIIEKETLSVMSIAETWLAPNANNPFNNPTFDLRKEATGKYTGLSARGGLTGFQCNKHTQLSLLEQDPHKQWTFTKIHNTIISFVYFPPSTKTKELDEYWDKVIRISDNGTKPLIIIGDMNARLGNITGDSRQDGHFKKVEAWLEHTNFHILNPSRGKWTTINKKGKGIPDHIIATTAATELVEDYIIYDETPTMSDHLPLILTIKLYNSTPYKNSFSRFNVKELQKETKVTQFNEWLEKNKHTIADQVSQLMNNITLGKWNTSPKSDRQQAVDNIYTTFTIWMHTAMANSCGMFHYRPRKEDQSEHIQELENEMKSQWHNMMNYIHEQDGTNFQQAYEQYLNKKRELKTTKNDEKRKGFLQLSEDMTDPSNRVKLVKMISSMKKRKGRSGNGLCMERIDEYTQYFERNTFGSSPTGTVMDGEAPFLNMLDQLSTYPQARNVPIDITKLQRIIKYLPSYKTPGEDRIHNEMIKASSEIAIPIISNMFDIFSRLGTMPSQWKVALIVPIYKNKGSAEDISNYRPIALTSCLRRVYERCLMTQIEFLEKALSPTQAGFRKGTSTMNQIMVMQTLCNEHPSASHAFLDIKAAYDCVDRRKLWNGLLEKGVPLETILIIKDLFDDNSSKLVINGATSQGIRNRRGLLQGSSLSPLLFNVFLDDLLQKLNQEAKLKMGSTESNNAHFADDGNLHADNANTLQQLLDVCHKWSTHNGISFAPQKCVAFVNDEETVQLGDEEIPKRDTMTYLGMEFKRTGIDWEKTTANRIKKFHQQLNWFRSNGLSLNGWQPTSNVGFYKTFLRPLLEYGMAVDIIPNEEMKVIQLAQNQALRSMFSTAHTTSTAAVHKLAGVPSMESRNRSLFATFYKKLKAKIQVRAHNEQKSLTVYRANDTKFMEKIKSDETWRLLDEQKHTNRDSLQILKKRIQANSIQEMTKKQGNVADVIWTNEALKPNPLLKCKIERNRLKTLIHWRLGRVAFHQECRNCSTNSTLSRQHAVTCTDAETKLSRFTPQTRSRHGTIIDDVLNNSKYLQDDYECLEEICKVIQEIRILCLGWKHDVNGELISPHNPRYEEHI